MIISKIRLSDTQLILGHPMAWYDPEKDSISIDIRIKPFWLVLLHELGHYLSGYLPQAVHSKVCVEEWWDNIFTNLRLNLLLHTV